MADKKGKKVMEGPVTKIEEKEIDFGDIELKIEKPVMDADKKGIIISGNFKEVGANIQKVVDRYKNTQLTEENVDYVKTLKKQFVSLRTGIERERKDYKKVYITPAEDLVDSMCKELLAIVDFGEKALGDQLDAYDEKRKKEITVVLTEFIDDTAQNIGLRDEYKAQILLKKEYYNKTADEAESMSDIEKQADELLKKQKEYDSGVALIRAECEDAKLLPDSYLRELQYKSATEIILEIKTDRKTRDEVQKKAEEEGKLTVGEPLKEELKKATALDAKETTNRTRVLRIVYKPENAKKIAQAMSELCVSFEFINTAF